MLRSCLILSYQIGIEVDRFSYKAKDLSLREVGGSFGPIWSDYYQDAKRILVCRYGSVYAHYSVFRSFWMSLRIPQWTNVTWPTVWIVQFVVDGASQRSWPAAAVLFWELVEDHALNNTPIAFALNKMYVLQREDSIKFEFCHSPYGHLALSPA